MIPFITFERTFTKQPNILSIILVRQLIHNESGVSLKKKQNIAIMPLIILFQGSAMQSFSNTTIYSYKITAKFNFELNCENVKRASRIPILKQ